MELKYKHALLFVDDEVSVTKALQRLFRKEGYEILTASSGREGLDLLKGCEKPVSLIISDQQMPEMTGSQFLEQAKEIFPEAIRFLLTGHSDMEAIVDAVNKGEIHRYFTKPWDNNDLLTQVRGFLEQYELKLENKRLLALTRKQNKELHELNKNLEQKVEERSQEIIAKNKTLATLNKQLEANLYNTVRSFASLAEMHTPAVAGHGRRVSALSRQVAVLLGLDEKDIINIEIAGFLHDIGKLGLPKKIIDYNQKTWSENEWAMYRSHPEEGQSIVRFINKLGQVAILIRAHHERYDGGGFPDQLNEEEIPLGARIIAVVDAYDRIVKLKADTKAILDEYLKEKKLTPDHLSEEELIRQAAINHLKRGAFSIYDPDIVKVFLDVLKKAGVTNRMEKRLALDSLREGMVLSRSLYSRKGRFLLPHDTVLTKEYINNLKKIKPSDPVAVPVYVIVK